MEAMRQVVRARTGTVATWALQRCQQSHMVFRGIEIAPSS